MASEGGGSVGRKTFALVLLCCASFVAVLDLTIVAIALPSVRRDLGFTGGDVQWILTGYALSFGGLRWGLWSAIAFALLALMLVAVCMRPGLRETTRSSSKATEC